MGDPARANMLCALKDDGVLTATELAHIAGVAPSTASEHLAKLTQAKMVAVRRQGRYRYYRLACDEVADALDSLVALAATTAPRDRLRMYSAVSRFGPREFVPVTSRSASRESVTTIWPADWASSYTGLWFVSAT